MFDLLDKHLVEGTTSSLTNKEAKSQEEYNTLFSSFFCLSFNFVNTPIQFLNTLVRTFQKDAFLAHFPYPNTSFVFLSTCNRFEIYGYLPNKQRLSKKEAIQSLVKHSYHDNYEHVGQFADFFLGKDVFSHLFSVAGGLQSMVLGETEILGQVSKAYETALVLKKPQLPLQRLFQTAISVGKRIHTETNVSKKYLGIGQVSVAFVDEKITHWTDKRIAILGAGSHAKVLYFHLMQKRPTQIDVFNRTQHKAKAIIKRPQDRAFSLSELPSYVLDYDVILACTSSKTEVFTPSSFPQPPTKQMLVFDTSNPANVSKKLSLYEHVELLGLEDLHRFVQQNPTHHSKGLLQAQKIIRQGIKDFQDLFLELHAVKTITSLREKASLIQANELEKLKSKHPNLSDEDLRLYTSFSNALLQKLLHHPTLFLRQEARENPIDFEQQEAWIQQLFGLEEP